MARSTTWPFATRRSRRPSRGPFTRIDPLLVLFAPSGSQLFAAGRAAGLRVAAEVFADRAYQPDGSLVPRNTPGAVIEDLDVVVARAIHMIEERTVVAIDGSVVALDMDTICVHGDTPGSAVLARRLRAGLEAAGITVRAVGYGKSGAGPSAPRVRR